MKRHILAVLLLIGAVAYSCTSIEEPLPAAQDGLATAIIEDFVLDGPATKTVVNFDSTNPSFSFTTTDILGVFPTSPESGDQQRFDVKTIEGTVATFNGNGFALKEGQKYAAYYPAILPAPEKDYIPMVYTGQVQTGKTTFGIAKADYLIATGIQPSEGVCTFSMKHVGALVVLDVTFPDAGTYTELSLTASAGSFVTEGSYDLTAPAQVGAFTTVSTAPTVTLALGENGAGFTVKRREKVRFCLMVAPKDLSAATLTLALKDSGNDQITMNLDGKNFVKGKAYLYNCAFTPVPFEEPTNLSAEETANTYIVDVDDINALGYYFDASVAGNGAAGVVTVGTPAGLYPTGGTYALTKTASTDSPIWLHFNVNNCVSDVAYDASEKIISFKATGNEGVAKISLDLGGHDAIWTWLIWCTDQPKLITYTVPADPANSFTIMDRNLGATMASPDELQSVDDIPKLCGLYYQWGRVTPLSPDYESQAFGSRALIGYNSMEACIMNADRFTREADNMFFNYWGLGGTAKHDVGVLWGNAVDQVTLWRPVFATPKTIYDPCPPGYQVAPVDFVRGLGGSAADPVFTNANAMLGSHAHGAIIHGDDGDVFFPYNGRCWDNGLTARWSEGRFAGLGLGDDDNDGCAICIWTNGNGNSNSCWRFNGIYYSPSNTALILQTLGAGAYAQGIRCVKSGM